uniref:DMA domain-containing protein n=1 Tax=Capitella teleta TaxID=283909 RepID=X1ZYE5_CAPTE
MSPKRPPPSIHHLCANQDRHQATDGANTAENSAKVKKAANLLQQRKMLQRNLRNLQQHTLSRDILATYRARLHSLPPPEALRSMFPYASERMRKRRCFADKELDAVMFEREKRAEVEKVRVHGIIQQAQSTVDPIRMRMQLMQQGVMGSPREFLQRIFPAANPNVLELVYQGCGGNLERAIEQIVSGAKVSAACNMQGAPWAPPPAPPAGLPPVLPGQTVVPKVPAFRPPFALPHPHTLPNPVSPNHSAAAPVSSRNGSSPRRSPQTDCAPSPPRKTPSRSSSSSSPKPTLSFSVEAIMAK